MRIKRFFSKSQKEGINWAVLSLVSYLLRKLNRPINRILWHHRYHPSAVPRNDQIYYISTEIINHTLSQPVLQEEIDSWVHQATLRDRITDNFQTHIVPGAWDKHAIPIENTYIYESLTKRFVENNPWESVKYYEKMKNNDFSKEEMNADYLGEVDAPAEYLKRYDRIYDSMSTAGYDPSYPITVHIGRNGEYIRHDGIHRLTLAKICDIPKIPVRVKFRHKDWQNTRDAVARGLEPDEEHPDLVDIK